MVAHLNDAIHREGRRGKEVRVGTMVREGGVKCKCKFIGKCTGNGKDKCKGKGKL